MVDNVADITYDQEFTYNNNEISGFYICCLGFDECNINTYANWELMPKESVTGIAPGNKVWKLLVTYENRLAHVHFRGVRNNNHC